MTSRRTRWWGHVVLVVQAVLVTAASLLAGTAGLLAASRATARPTLFLAAAGIAGTVVLAGGVRWLLRPGRHSERATRAAAVVTSASVVAVVFAALVPASPRTPAASVPEERFWQLPTGSGIRYVETPAHGQRRPDPVVFLHGGPGVADLAGDSSYSGQLADDGWDVYVYDQLGTGGSTRLDQPAGYTFDRDVADLEAIRQTIGAQHLVLVGFSYGAQLAAGYLAAYPDRVARAVFSSPGSLDPSDTSGGNLVNRLTLTQRAALYLRVVQPRNLLVYGLLQVNPDAAHALAGDAEMDGRNDLVYRQGEPALHCPGLHDPNPAPTGNGFYRLQYFQSATAAPLPDLRPRLNGRPAPALIIKGRCDYESWSSAISYRTTLPHSALVYLGAGHNAYQDQPEQYLQTLTAFLDDQPLPFGSYPDLDAPADFEGPR